MFTESSPGSLTLVISEFPKELNIIHKGLKMLPNNHQYTLPNGTLLQIQVRGSWTELYCPVSKVYMKLENASVADCEIVRDILNHCTSGDPEVSGTVKEYSFDDLRNGIFCESEGTMLRILQKALAKKRLKILMIVTKFCCLCRHRKFIKKYYSPPNGRGYLKAKCNFESLSVTRKQMMPPTCAYSTTCRCLKSLCNSASNVCIYGQKHSHDNPTYYKDFTLSANIYRRKEILFGI